MENALTTCTFLFVAVILFFFSSSLLGQYSLMTKLKHRIQVTAVFSNTTLIHFKDDKNTDTSFLQMCMPQTVHFQMQKTACDTENLSVVNRK